MNYRMLIDNKLVTAEGSFPVVNPATAQAFASAPDATHAHLELAVSAANGAFPKWSCLALKERGAYLFEIKKVLENNCDELAELITREQGKPLNEAKGEVQRSCQLVAGLTSIQLPTETYIDDDNSHAYSQYKPLGVVAAISPWNYPMLGAIAKIISAVYVGNTLILKPSPFTPLCVLRLGELMQGILPEGVVNIISGGADLGRWITEQPMIKAISFTGSAIVGKKIMSSCGDGLKRVILELGGNDAAIVLKDINPQQIAEHLIANAFGNSGQICIAIKRLYVHEDIFDALSDALVNALEKVRVGDGMVPATTMGPLQNLRQVSQMDEFLKDALEGGSRIIYQSTIPESPGFYYPATLLTNLPENAKILKDEAFGPILPVLPFRDVDAAVAAANNCSCGLGGSVWTNDIEEGTRVAASLQCGTAWVNQHRAIHPLVPFGGIKESGVGCEMGLQGLLAFTDRRVINIRRRAL